MKREDGTTERPVELIDTLWNVNRRPYKEP